MIVNQLNAPGPSWALSAVIEELDSENTKLFYLMLNKIFDDKGKNATLDNLEGNWKLLVSDKYEIWKTFSAKKTVEADLIKGKPHPKLKDIIALAKKHKATIAAALAGSIFGVNKAIEEAIASSATLDAAVAAQMAVDAHINFDSKKSIRMLVNVYQDGSSLGQGADPSAIVGPRVQQLIDRAGITIKNIDDTTQNRIYTAIRDGVTNGDNHQTISDAVNEIIDDPDRAEIIAATETNRAYNLANLDTAAENGAIGFNWITEPTACIECLTLESANPHDISELPPPEHPNCMCWTEDVYPDTTDSTGE